MPSFIASFLGALAGTLIGGVIWNKMFHVTPTIQHPQMIKRDEIINKAKSYVINDWERREAKE